MYSFVIFYDLSQVATEMVRLIDEVAMEQQTDENGDLFLWLKHQAQKGVQSAQVSLSYFQFSISNLFKSFFVKKNYTLYIMFLQL